MNESYQEQLRQEQRLRCFLFSFLTTYADANPFLEQIVQQVAPFLNEENQVWLEALVVQGQEIITETLIITRKILQEQTTSPLINVDQTEWHGVTVEAGSLPLWPTISPEDQAHLSKCLTLLREWHQDFILFLKEQKQDQK